MSVSGPSQQNQSCFPQIIQDEIYLDGRRIKSEDDSLFIDTGAILPEDMSSFYSVNFPNLSAVSASECNIQSFTTISSGIAPEAELSIAEDKGVNTSTRDLVLTAITVMKGRKARPDTKRICNWVNRKYGRSVQEVVQEIDDLCQQAILEKVDYKGSISFRITSEKKLHKRVGRRKNSSIGNLDVPQSSEESFVKLPRNQSPKKSPKTSPKNRENGAEKMDPVTLNLLLREEMNVFTDGLVTKDNIVKALELTKRPINKRAVYRDLETILAHEIHLGYLVKHADNFILASINKDKHYRGTIPLKSSKRKPKPTQKYLEMEAELQKNKPDKYSDFVTFDPEGNFPFYNSPGNSINPSGNGFLASPCTLNSSPSSLNNSTNGLSASNSEEELKEALIKEKLISNSLLKMKSKMKSGKGKTKKEFIPSPVHPAPVVEILPVETPVKAQSLDETTVTIKENKKSVLIPVKPKIKKETWQVSITVKEARSRPVPPVEDTKPQTKPSTDVVPHREKKDNAVENRRSEKTAEPKQLKENKDHGVPSDGLKKEEEKTAENEAVEPEDQQELKPKRSARKRRIVNDESDEEESMTEVAPIEPTTRTLSGRKKRARKIFDPADHDVPSRIIKKCRTNSPTQEPSCMVAKSGTTDGKENNKSKTDGDCKTKPTDNSSKLEVAADDQVNSSQTSNSETNLTKRQVQSRRLSVESNRTAKEKPKDSVEKLPRLKKEPESEETVRREEIGGTKRKSSVNGHPPLTRRSSDTPQAKPQPKETRRKSVDKAPEKKEVSPPSLPKNEKKSTNSSPKVVEKPSYSNPKSEKVRNETKLVGPRKTADPIVKTSPNVATSTKIKKEIPKKSSTDETTEANEVSPKRGVETNEKPKKKPELDPLFKVPAPKKPLSKSSNADSHIRQGNLKNKSNKHIKASSARALKSTKTSPRSTRTSALSVSLRAKKEPKEKGICMNCNTGNKKNEKLIYCKDCDKVLHPSCLNYPEDLTDRIYKQPWQCIDCKTCFVCVKSGNDDKMLFCDSCDLGYHMSCHRPSITRKPRGRWECDSCAAETGYRGETDEKFNPPGAATYFEELLPALPPGASCWPALGLTGSFCPAPDQYPPNWKDLPIDESIPDISCWSAARMSQYLVQNGIKDTAAKVFFDQEIDGASALVLQRKDVLQGLGLKLGPALKIFHHIKRLQTRRNFGLVA